ncbi:MAG: aminotransferase class I/II-fold pyridoxal phosphate-dependent enzyme [Candidatus Marinimicrobia bacterium]|nr:aminotransferase class I/II-fold pyridoxal phosphate-dependent enzyme [Candidatus Neomarinimicrobiota bacterium]MDD5582576.1 aminotransferase class I/II-fold pyridoxal phosphate-dependent enzyme [Candidatus Neomarinimicrobiota bacterium]
MQPILTAKRVENVKYAIRDIVIIANRARAAGKKIINLNIGDPNIYGFRTPQHIIDAVSEAMNQNMNGYSPSPGIDEALEAVRKQANRSGIQNIQDIFISTGASEAIELCLTALLNPGDNILLPYPGYPLYSSVVGKLSAEINPYYLNEEDNWNLDVANIESCINERTKGIVIINPNNPTGAIYPPETLKQLIDLAQKYNLLIMSDEIYDKLCFHGNTYTSLASLTKDTPIVTFNGLSKSYLVPGFRMGWAIFSGPEELIGDYIEGVNRMVRARLSANHPMQYAIKPALEMDQSHIHYVVQELEKRNQITTEMLNDIPEITCVPAQAAFYAFPTLNIPEKDLDFVTDLIMETGVVVVHGSGFGQKEGTQHMRVVFLPEEKLLREAYEKIRDFIQKRYHS